MRSRCARWTWALLQLLAGTCSACQCKVMWSAPGCRGPQSRCPSAACNGEEQPWCIADGPCDYGEDYRGEQRFFCALQSGFSSSRCPGDRVLANVNVGKDQLLCRCIAKSSPCFESGTCEENPHCIVKVAEACSTSGDPNSPDGEGTATDGKDPNGPSGDKDGPGGPEGDRDGPGGGQGGPDGPDGPDGDGPDHDGPGGGPPGPWGSKKSKSGPGGGDKNGPNGPNGQNQPPGQQGTCQDTFDIPTRQGPLWLSSFAASGFRTEQLNTWFVKAQEPSKGHLCGESDIWMSQDFTLVLKCQPDFVGRQVWVISSALAGADRDNDDFKPLAESKEECSIGADPQGNFTWVERDGCETQTRREARFEHLGPRPIEVPSWTAAEKQALWKVLDTTLHSGDMNKHLARLALSPSFVGADAFDPCSTLSRSFTGLFCHCGARYSLSLTKLIAPVPPAIGNLTGMLAFWAKQVHTDAVLDPSTSIELPKEIGQLKHLQVLRIEHAASLIGGPIPKELGDLPMLQELMLMSNSLSGVLPNEVSRLRKVRSMDLRDNQLAGGLPPDFLEMRSLKLLNLAQNNVAGVEWKGLGVEMPCLTDVTYTCPPGTYRTEVAKDRPAEVQGERRGGRFQMLQWQNGDYECLPCPPAMTSLAGAEKIDQCFCDSRFQDITRYSSTQTCGCLNGYHLNHQTMSCRPCERGLDCKWHGNGTASLQPPVAKRGYWVAPVENLSAFSDHEVFQCHSKETCLGESTCVAGRTGEACSSCLPGHHGGPNGECERCTSTPEQHRWNLALYAFGCVPLMIPIAQILRSTRQRKFSRLFRRFRVALRQLLKYFQLLLLISGFRIAWPAPVQMFWDFISGMSMNFYFSLGCLAHQQTVQLEMAVLWLMPVAFVFLSCLMVPFSRGLQLLLRCTGNLRLRGWSEQISVTFMDALILDYFAWTVFFAGMLKSSIRMITCREDPEEGMLRVVDFPHMGCWKHAGKDWINLFPGTVMSTVLYVWGYLLVTWFLVRLVKKEMLASGGENRGTWFFVCDGFRNKHVRWPLIMAGKDVAVNIVTVSFSTDGTSQVLASAFVVSVYLYWLFQARPFGDESLNVMEIWSMGSVLCTLFFAGGLGAQLSVSELVDEGLADTAMLSRAVWLLVVMVIGLIVPAWVMLYQLALLIPPIAKRLPSCLLPCTAEERASRLDEIEETAGAIPTKLRVVLEGMDDIEWQRFDSALSTASSSTGVITPTDSRLLGMVRIKSNKRRRSHGSCRRSSSMISSDNNSMLWEDSSNVGCESQATRASVAASERSELQNAACSSEVSGTWLSAEKTSIENHSDPTSPEATTPRSSVTDTRFTVVHSV